MIDTIYAAICQHLRERYPQYRIISMRDTGTSIYPYLVNEYLRIERPLTTTNYTPHCYLFHQAGQVIIFNEHFQETRVDLTHPDSITHIHNLIQDRLREPNPHNTAELLP